MRIRTFAAAALAAALATAGTGAPAVAQSQPETAGQIRVGSATLSLSGRVQTQFNSTTVDGEPPTQWIIRRARFEVLAKVNELVGGKVQPDFSGERFTLKDAFVELSFSPALQVLAGQAHRPFGILTRFSSLRMPPIEKGAEIRGTKAWDEVNLVKDLGYSNRDIGLQVSGEPEGAPLGLAYDLAFLQGPDGDVAADGAMPQVVARLAVSPLDGVTIGGSWSRRDFARGVVGSPDTLRSGSALALDLAITPRSGASGLLLLAEVTSGDFDPWRNATFRGAHVWAAYDLVPGVGPVSMVEPLLRVSYGELDGAPGLSGGTLITPGVNLYLGGLNRVMLNYDVWSAAGGEVDRSFKAMFQLAF